eukprot:COSAG06_NODE_25407_length_637_cov_5.895911_1_plen_39_part_10
MRPCFRPFSPVFARFLQGATGIDAQIDTMFVVDDGTLEL